MPTNEKSTLLVRETFASLQGESTYAGCPCFFIRLAGCNLACRYCDTSYARGRQGRNMRIGALVKAFRASGLPLVEVTGGEPLLQAATLPLLRQLRRHGRVLLETNGSLDISAVPAGVIVIMDIKTPDSGCADRFDFRNIGFLRPDDEVKFVICSRRDYLWACDFVRRRQLFRRCAAVLFSPASGRLPASRLARWIVEDKLPVRLNLQLHKIIWPHRRRGV